MSRRYVSVTDWRWLMVCDHPDCTSVAGPFQAIPALAEMAALGWFVAAVDGDRCPRCPAPVPRVEAHRVMKTVRRRKLVREPQEIAS